MQGSAGQAITCTPLSFLHSSSLNPPIQTVLALPTCSRYSRKSTTAGWAGRGAPRLKRSRGLLQHPGRNVLPQQPLLRSAGLGQVRQAAQEGGPHLRSTAESNAAEQLRTKGASAGQQAL